MLQLSCLSQSFLINNTVNHSLEFWRGWYSKTIKRNLGGSSTSPSPCFLEEHVLMLWLLILVSSLFLSSSFLMEGMKLPLYSWWGSLFWWVGAFCIREVDRCCPSSWHGGYLPVSLPPFVMFGLAYCDPVPWVVAFIVGFTICQYQWALMSFPLAYIRVPSEVRSHITLPEVFTHPWWMLW